MRGKKAKAIRRAEREAGIEHEPQLNPSPSYTDKDGVVHTMPNRLQRRSRFRHRLNRGKHTRSAKNRGVRKVTV